MVRSASAEDEPAPVPNAYGADVLPFGTARIAHGIASNSVDQAREAAIDMALEWLAAHQADDGRFPAADFPDRCAGAPFTWPPEATDPGRGQPRHDVGVTGLALTAFLHAGYTHRGGHRFARSIGRGLRWLVSTQGPGGAFAPADHPQLMYEHAFATLAVVNAHAMTGSPFLRHSATMALEFAQAGVGPGGGWGYGIRAKEADTSVTGAMLLPIFTARTVDLAAAQAERDPPYAAVPTGTPNAQRWIHRLFEAGSKRVGYRRPGTPPQRYGEATTKFPERYSESLNAIAVLFYEPVDHTLRKQPAVRQMLARMHAARPKWLPTTGSVDLMYWWYGALAMHRAGGKRAVEWIDEANDALVRAQHTDGDVCARKGSWDPVGVWGSEGGRVYATAVACLTLSAGGALPWRGGSAVRSSVLAGHKELPSARKIRALAGTAAQPTAEGTKAALVGLAAEDPAVRRAAALALGRIGKTAASKAVVAALGDHARKERDAVVRRACLWALGRVAEDRRSARAQLPAKAKVTDPGERFLRALAEAQIRGVPHPARRGVYRYIPDPELLLRFAGEREMIPELLDSEAPGAAALRSLRRRIAGRLELPALIDASGAPAGMDVPLIPDALLQDETTRRALSDLLARTTRPDTRHSEVMVSPDPLFAEDSGIAPVAVALGRLLLLRYMREVARADESEQRRRGVSRAQLIESGPLLAAQAERELALAQTHAGLELLRLEAAYLRSWFELEAKHAGDAMRAQFEAVDDVLWLRDGTTAARRLSLRKAHIIEDFAERAEDTAQQASLYEGALVLMEDAALGDVRRPADRVLVMHVHASRAEVCRRAGRVGSINFLRRGRGFLVELRERVPDFGVDPVDESAVRSIAFLLNDSGDQNGALRLLKESAARASAAGHTALAARMADVRARMLSGE